MVLNSLGIVTVLKPLLGYKQCAEIAREGYESSKSLHQIVVLERQPADAGSSGTRPSRSRT
jgi:aspartate ammonia-lyase